MASNDTHTRTPAANRRRRAATITDIGDALRRKRNRHAPDPDELPLMDTDDAPIPADVPVLEAREVLGYLRHEGRCIQVQYAAAECLWLYERPLNSDVGAVTEFAGFGDLKYAQLGQVTWVNRTLQFAYAGNEIEPAWMAIPSPSLADLLRKVFSLYDVVMKGAKVKAAEDLVPNPAPRRYDPNRRAH